MTRARLLILFTLLGTALASGQAAIDYVDGDVWIVRSGSATREPADFGSALAPGDRIVTGANGTAVVNVSEGSQIKLRENTEVVMDDLVAGSVELRQGGVFARVRQTAGTASRRFQVTTQTVVAGVRGTEFFVAYGRTIEDLPDLWLCVNEGAVDVAVAGTDSVTTVNAGEGVNILSGARVTEPRFYPWTLDLNWNFDAQDGPVLDTTDLDAAYGDLLDQDYD